MDESYDIWLKKINENSLKAHQREEEKRIREEEYKLKREKKERFWKRVRALLAIFAICTTIGYTASIGIDAIKREKELQSANTYINAQMDFVCPELDRGVLSDNSIYLFDNGEENLRKLSDELINEYGLSRDCAIYCISQKYGDDGFNKIVRSYGYKDKDSFLYELYSKPTSISSSGNTVYSKIGSYKVFENNIQVELVKKVNEIKKMMDDKRLDSKGLSL